MLPLIVLPLKTPASVRLPGFCNLASGGLEGGVGEGLGKGWEVLGRG